MRSPPVYGVLSIENIPDVGFDCRKMIGNIVNTRLKERIFNG